MLKRAIIVGFLSVVIAACSDPEGAKKAAEDAGYENVSTSGYSWFSCGKDDTFSTGFSATNAHGRPVRGVVCSGWLKGATVRLF